MRRTLESGAAKALLVVVLLLTPPTGLAQETAPEETEEGAPEGATTASILDPQLTGEGLRLGTFLVNVGAMASIGYDDNIFATRNDKIDDGIGILGLDARIAADRDWGQLAIYGGADLARYLQNTDENYEEFRFGVDGHRHLTDTSRIFGSLERSRNHEERESPDASLGQRPTIYWRDAAVGGLAYDGERYPARLGVSAVQLDFDDTPADGGDINEDDRDRDEFLFGGRIGRRLEPRHELFLQTFGDIRRYDRTPDDGGADRSSAGLNTNLGYHFRLGPALDLEAMAGMLMQDYEGSGLQDVLTFDLGGRATWRPDDVTVVTARLDRSVQETTFTGASSYVSTVPGVEVTGNPRPDLEGSAGLFFFDDDYQGGGRHDTGWIGLLGTRWYFTPHSFVGADYRYIGRDSNDPNEDYDDNQFFARAGVQLAPAYTAEEHAAAPSLALDRLYAGVTAARSFLSTELEGPRGGAEAT